MTWDFPLEFLFSSVLYPLQVLYSPLSICPMHLSDLGNKRSTAFLARQKDHTRVVCEFEFLCDGGYVW